MYTQAVKVAMANALSPAPLRWSPHITDKRIADYVSAHKKKTKKSRANKVQETREDGSDSNAEQEPTDTPKAKKRQDTKERSKPDRRSR